MFTNVTDGGTDDPYLRVTGLEILVHAECSNDHVVIAKTKDGQETLAPFRNSFTWPPLLDSGWPGPQRKRACSLFAQAWGAPIATHPRRRPPPQPLLA